jgi:hypothetical protein
MVFSLPDVQNETQESEEKNGRKKPRELNLLVWLLFPVSFIEKISKRATGKSDLLGENREVISFINSFNRYSSRHD